MLISRREDLDKEVTRPAKNILERRELDSQPEHHSLYDQLVDPETYLPCSMKKRNEKLEERSCQATNLR